MNNKSVALALLATIGLSVSGCTWWDDPSTELEHSQQEQLAMQSLKTVGMPNITLFSEKEMMKSILESRDHMYPTYTYLFNAMQGTIGQKICDSVGYGLDGATQYSNPNKVVTEGGSVAVTIPQADPNGLYSPSTSRGTWILCKVPGKNKVEAQRIEPDVITLTFPKESIQ